MKRNLLGLAAIVLAIAVSSFTVKKTVISYLKFKTGVSVEKNLNNYTKFTSQPAVDPGTTTINWFKIEEDDGIITTDEFNAGFEVYDVTNTNSNQLSDEAEISGELDKR